MPTLQIDGSSVFYDDKGKGMPIVLLHAFPLNSRMYQAQAADLSSRFRVITPDFRGFGQSTNEAAFTVPSLADDIHKLLTKLDALPCILGGVSMGGYVAMNFAAKFGSDLRGLILCDTKDAGDGPEQKENRNRMIDVARTKGSAAVADLMQPKMFSADTTEHRPDLVKALRAMMESTSAQTIAFALAALRDRPDMTELLPTFKMPTLIIVGEQDGLTPVNVAEAMHKRIKGSELKIIPATAHLPPMEQATLVNRAIRQFAETIK